MTARPQLYAVTANRLWDGVPIYFTAGGGWSPRVADAATDYDGEALLARSGAGNAGIETIGRIAIEVDVSDGNIQPTSLKERIRAFGPTV